MKPDISLAPLDVGFDLRVHAMWCAIPADATCVRYEQGGDIRDAAGDLAQIIQQVVLAGYRVRVPATASEDVTESRYAELARSLPPEWYVYRAAEDGAICVEVSDE